MPRKKSAGQLLRARFDETLAYESRRTGRSLEWSDHELTALDAAADAADMAEVLRERWEALTQNPDASVTALVKLAAERRALDRQVNDLLARVAVELKPTTQSRIGRPGTA
ncbi:hypothetical protein [Mycolicibacterium sp. GESEQ-9]|uniref:hypothetical protein n=1 Tax=Mycolicibacterium sp. GESEQ-9 TaxID=2812656 RepID=UPI001B31D99B|nr:hypothetical protein [Mycolicibacterium sp. GESEQ-9]